MPGRTRSAIPRKLSSNMPIPMHDLGFGRHRAHRRIGRRLVAGDDDEPWLLVDRLAVSGSAPGVRDAAAVGRARQVVDVRGAEGDAGLVGDERVDGAGRRRVGDRRPGAASGLQPELDDRRALDDGLVADDGDRLRVAQRRERRAERVEHVGNAPPGSTAAFAPSPWRSSFASA